ncbi:hypothetical protein DUI87_03057 [Hirundo rustica rustica]|uniref:Peptidase A2 domain-containing protein n=1 Tax=Hirundo rustica rustica TaxID=333673 RepID=A0A3M0LDY4_HIRRU|nr:hypothetical protein DUI87_03057 [Hirundo rustica rustica]
MEGQSPSPPECSPSSPAAPVCVSATEPSDRSPVAGAGSSATEDAVGLATAAGPTPPPLPAASIAAATGGEVFKFSANGDTAGMRPVFGKSKSSHAVGSSSTAWTLPPCQVTVRPKDRWRFWGEVKAKIEGLNDGADAGAGPAVSDVQLVPSRVPASDPVGSTGQDKAGRLTAAVEKQVSDPATRKLMLQFLAQGNCNAVCKRIIEALPGEPSMSDMVGACAKFGKCDAEREGETRADTNVSASAPTNGDLLSRLAASTHGSAGVDVCTAESVVIDSDKIHKVPLDAFGPLGDGMSAFLMGRSSATIQGIMVHLGLIDADFSGQVHAMVSTPTPPLTIPKGTQIAQLVPFKSSVSRMEDRSRGDGGFGSTGPPQVHWTAVLTKDRPETLCTVSMVGATPSEINLHGLLDTGADVSILSLAAWPPQWPLSLAKTSIAGLGGTKQCYMSQNPVAITNPEGQAAIIWPHVTEIPQNLWGRDVLAAWGMRLGTDF